jgi:hypothetical protein
MYMQISKGTRYAHNILARESEKSMGAVGFF